MQALSALRPLAHSTPAQRFGQNNGGAAQPQAQIGFPTLFACEACGGKNKAMDGNGGFMHEHGHHLALGGVGLGLLAVAALVLRRIRGKRQSQPPSA